MVMSGLTPMRFYREAYAAITDFRSYRKIFQQSPLRSSVYLFWLALHSALVFTLAFGWHDLPSAYRFLDWAQDNFPPLQIADGKLSVPGEQPIVMEYLGDEIYTFVFDTREEPVPLAKLNEPAVVFTRESLYFLVEGQQHSWPWEQSAPVLLGRNELLELEQVLRWGFYPLAGLFFFVVAFLGKAFQALLLTFLAFSASARHLVRLPFHNYLTITLYALTPAVVLDLAVTASGQEIPLFSIIYWVTAGLYAYLSTQKCVALEE